MLITTRKWVPHGTNGGISLLGCIMSLLGGMFIGMGVVIMDLLWFFCVPSINGRNINLGFFVWLGINSACLMLFGGFMGLAGSLLDSLLGASL